MPIWSWPQWVVSGAASCIRISDVDLLILRTEADDRPDHSDALERFVQVLWDADLHPGQSVRTLADCIDEARRDVGVATNLMEARLLAGRGELFAAMREANRSTGVVAGQ